MAEIDASDYQSLHKHVHSMSAGELTRTVQQQEGGTRQVLDTVFEGITQAFLPEKAEGARAVIQHELRDPDGVYPYALRIADGTCTLERAMVDDASATVRAGVGEYLGILTGKLNPMTAMMTGKLKASGDLMLLQKMQLWFRPPAER